MAHGNDFICKQKSHFQHKQTTRCGTRRKQRKKQHFEPSDNLSTHIFVREIRKNILFMIHFLEWISLFVVSVINYCCFLPLKHIFLMCHKIKEKTETRKKFHQIKGKFFILYFLCNILSASFIYALHTVNKERE